MIEGGGGGWLILGFWEKEKYGKSSKFKDPDILSKPQRFVQYPKLSLPPLCALLDCNIFADLILRRKKSLQLLDGETHHEKIAVMSIQFRIK